MTPSFIKVLINGQETPEFLDTLECTITHQLNHHSTCSVKFREAPASRFFFDSLLGKDMVMKAVDADGAELELFKGVMQQADADWELNGSAVLTFTGISKSYTLDTFNRSQTFNQLPLIDAAQRLTGPLTGDTIMTDPGELNMLQFNETDWSFLHRLVDRFGGFLRIKGNNIDIFDEFQGEGVQVGWRQENGLSTFRTTGRLCAHQAVGANFVSENATSQQSTEIIDVPAENSLAELRDGAKNGSGSLGLATGLWNATLAGTQDRFDKALQLESQRQLMSTCRAFGESRIPEIVTGDKIEVTNQDDVPGKYGVIKITHSWKPGRGYRNAFECTPFKHYMDPVQPPVERYYGPEIARVAETSPSQGSRTAHVRVNFLWTDHNDSGFLPLMTPNAGEDRGICFIPEVGDEVLVFFRGGDSSKPFVMGCRWNGIDLPPLDDLHGGEYRPNDLKRIVTKSGNRLVFDDKPGKETMVMATPRHVRVSLFDGGQTLLLHSDGDIHINAGGTVHMKCNQFLREIG
ncbi:MAG: phage baseplate assembly protein V [Bryobacteraceae bacterium]|nr:phage baseplate assembly protein V [Bryobacteraceae bacterium]